jgi:malic enzyme
VTGADQPSCSTSTRATVVRRAYSTWRRGTVLSLQDVKLVIKGAGAASIARIELLKAMGLAHENAIIATGRSDYPNRVNNVLGFPTSFGAPLTCAPPRSTTP